MAIQDPPEQWDDLEALARGAARGQCPVPLPWISLGDVDVDDKPTDQLLDDHAQNEKAVEDKDNQLKDAQQAEDAAEKQLEEAQKALDSVKQLPDVIENHRKEKSSEN